MKQFLLLNTPRKIEVFALSTFGKNPWKTTASLRLIKKMVGAKRNFGSLDLTNGVRRQTFRSKDIERNDNLNHKRLHDLTQFLSSHDKNLSYHLKAFHRHPI